MASDVSLKEFFCEYFELDFSFSLSDFDKNAFLKNVNVEERESYSFGYGSLSRPGEQHAHIDIVLRPNAPCRAKIAYHRSEAKFLDERPPYMEDCARWLGGFLRTKDVAAEVVAVYLFDKGCSLILGLPFPLITTSKELAGSLVAGITIEFPARSRLRRAVIQKEGENTRVLAMTKSKIRLRVFDLEKELAQISSVIVKIVKPRGGFT